MAHEVALDQAPLGLFDLTEQAALDRANQVWMHPEANRMVHLHVPTGVVRVGYLWVAAKRRTIGMQISAQGLQVRAPRWVQQVEIEKLLQSRARWIMQKLEQLQQLSPPSAHTASAWGEGACIAWQGQWVRLALGLAGRSAVLKALDAPEPVPSDVRLIGAAAVTDAAVAPSTGLWAGAAPTGDAALATVRHVLYLPLPANAQGDAVAGAAQRWLRQQAQQQLVARAAHFAPLMGVRPSRLSLTSADTRWGSASSQGAIRLHWRLAQMDPILFDYVLVHELAHLHEMNHSDRFWAWVQHVQPDYAHYRQRLKQMRLEPWDQT